MRQPLVTIITPCRNSGWRLLRCLDSVRAQTYPRVEHVVIDGASTDGTVEHLTGRPGLIWRSEPDSGQSEAINKGLAIARGDIIGWLNADDVLVPEALEHVVRVLGGSSRLGWVSGDMLVTEGGEVRRVRAPRKVGPGTFLIGNPIPQPSSFLTAWAWREIGGLAEDLHYSMDLDLWLRLVRRGIPYARIPRVLAIFEVHGDSKGGSVPYDVWMLDSAVAALRNGHLEAAAALAGRAAALRRLRCEPERELGSVLDDVLASLEGRGRLDRSVARATADVETGRCALRSRRMPGVQALFRPGPWCQRAGRALLYDAVRGSITHRIRAYR